MLQSTRPFAASSIRTSVSSAKLAPARPQANRRLISRAAEAPTSSSVDDQADVQLSVIDRAWRAVEAETVDKEVLSSCLTDLEAEMSSLRDAVTSAETKSQALESSIASAKDQYLRLNADFDNFRRRSREESTQLAESVRADVVKDLLPLIDNFELARTNVKAETESELKINNSYQTLYKQMVDIIRALGVEAVPTTGMPFDPALHDAIMRAPSADHPDGTVLQEFRKGFRLKDRLLRPAMVQVSYAEDGAPISSSEE